MSSVTRGRTARESNPASDRVGAEALSVKIDAGFRLKGPHRDHVAFPADPGGGRDRLIASVMPMLVRQCNRFLGRHPRLRVQFDLEDLLQECWVALIQRFPVYDPARGKFTTFAGLIARQTLCSVAERARTVRVGRDALEKLDSPGDYAPADLMPIRRAMAPTAPIEGQPLEAGGPGVPELAARAESAELAREAVSELVSRLPRRGAAVVRRFHGLGGGRGEAHASIGRRLGLSCARVTVERSRAEAAFRAAPETPALRAALAACGAR